MNYKDAFGLFYFFSKPWRNDFQFKDKAKQYLEELPGNLIYFLLFSPLHLLFYL